VVEGMWMCNVPLSYQRNSDIRERLKVTDYSWRHTKIPTKVEELFWKNGKELLFTVGIPLLAEGVIRLGMIKMMMKRPYSVC